MDTEEIWKIPEGRGKGSMEEWVREKGRLATPGPHSFLPPPPSGRLGQLGLEQALVRSRDFGEVGLRLTSHKIF